MTTATETTAAALPPVRSEPLLANRPVVEATIWRLVEEAQDRYRPGAEIASEEIIAWLTSRTTHWFANSPMTIKTHSGEEEALP